MSYYDKYLKYKNKYLQYKNSLGLNMHGGQSYYFSQPRLDSYSRPLEHNVKSNDILNINNLTDTPLHLTTFAGGAYKRKIKSKHEQEKLLKLLDTPNSHSGYSENSENREKWINNSYDMLQKTLPHVDKNHKYFATDTTSSSSSPSSDITGI